MLLRARCIHFSAPHYFSGERMSPAPIGTTPSKIALALIVGSLFFAVPHRAHAAGIESTTGGTISLGRAANYLRVDDFMAIWQSPANLAVVAGANLGGEFRLPVLQACFDRAKDNSRLYRTTNPERGQFGEESFQNVCNEGTLIPTGNLGFVQAFDSGFGWGLGFFTPTAIPAMKYGNDVIVTQVPTARETLPITMSGVESPNRPLLLERDVLGGFIQAGAGYQFVKQFRIGLSLGAGFASIHNVNVGSIAGGTFRDQELLTDIHVSDSFIPRATVSFVAAPIDELEILGQLTYQSDIEADGHVEFTGNGIQNAPLTDCRVQEPGQPGPHCRSDGATLRVPYPNLEATIGARYAKRRAARERSLDPMRDEIWDVEIDGYWSQTSSVDQYVLTLYTPMTTAHTGVAFSSAPGTNAVDVPPQNVIPYNWRDTLGVRIGGDYNVVPEMLALRLGFSYESRAIPVEYMNIDAFAVGKLGIHVGGTLALGPVRLSAGYAHVFFQPIDVGVGTGKINELVSQNPAGAQAVNEGYYQAALDIFSVQANATF